MKKNWIKIFGLLFVLTSCGSSDPRVLAREYCKCFRQAKMDAVALQECQELAAEHKEIIARDQQASQVYAQEILRCAVYEKD